MRVLSLILKGMETTQNTPKIRKDLSADALIGAVRKNFETIADPEGEDQEIALVDALMSAYAMFSLKDPSLLAFDRRRRTEEQNLKSIYGMERIPCDTQLRARLDRVDPDSLRRAYKEVFRRAQRGKVLEEMLYLDGHYIVSVDGTGYFSSEKIHSPFCMEKKSKSGKTIYYLQTLEAAIVRPNKREVIALPPEPIRKQDGQTKNDCERNACRRWLKKFRKDHPHLKVIIVEDGLSPNAPHIRDLREHGCRFILSCKEDDHPYLFRYLDGAVEEGRSVEHSMPDGSDEKINHHFRFTEDVPLNGSNQDIRVNVLEYWEAHDNGALKYFCWVTDMVITKDNVYRIMRAGRARWKIENETINTLKNQGYHLEHNYGLGEKYLSSVFVSLMMLAFLVDQVQQMCCPLFQAVWAKLVTKRELWEALRSTFRMFVADSMEMLYRIILMGRHKVVVPSCDSS